MNEQYVKGAADKVAGKIKEFHLELGSLTSMRTGFSGSSSVPSKFRPTCSGDAYGVGGS
jgi:hypothetical protein